MRRTLLIVALLLVICGLLWEFVPIPTMIWDGSFELTVTVSSSGEGFRSVSCHAFAHQKEAEQAGERMLEYQRMPEMWQYSSVADPFEGHPLKVRVLTSGRQSPLGRELRYIQYRSLLVIAQFKDGRHVGKVVEIPDGRIARSVNVTFP